MLERWLGLIPARYGSKSIPQKNIRPFLGRPLLEWTIDSARKSGAFEKLIVSTDHDSIADLALKCGATVPFLRPADLGEDTTPTAMVVRHVVDELQNRSQWMPDWIMVLEPTSPARRPFHIREAIELCRSTNADSVASVSEVSHHFVPSKLLSVKPDGLMAGIDGTPIVRMKHRRQDLEAYYAFNGLVFACHQSVIRRNPATLWGERVFALKTDNRYTIDLDNPTDWRVGECRMRLLMEEELYE